MKLGRMIKAAVIAAAMTIASDTAVYADIQQDLSAASVVEQIKRRGVLTVGVSTFVPWSMRDKKGDLIGFEIDVAKKLASDMEVDIEFVPTSWAGIVPALISGKFDIIISGMSITPARNMTVNFTTPYAHSGQQMLGNKKLAEGFAMEDYNASGVVFVCRRSAPTCDTAEKLFPKAEVRRFDDDAQSLQEVLNGNAHAWISSSPKPKFAVLDNPDVLYMVSEENLTEANEAIALRKGDPDSLNFFSNWILFNTANGWMQETHDYWFNTRDWADDIGPDQ